MSVIYPKADSVSRKERIMSEWALTNLIRILTPQWDGTFKINEDGTKICIHGYYCELDSTPPTNWAYITVNIKDGWFYEVVGDVKFADTKEQIDEDTDDVKHFSIDFKNAPRLEFLNHDFCPFIISPTAPKPEEDDNDKKIWIDSAHLFTPAVWDGQAWRKLGAVYK